MACLSVGEGGAFEVALLAANLLQHADLRLGAVGARRLERVLVTANLHRSHHSTQRADVNSNFGSLFSLWDQMAGTLRRVAPERVEVGAPDEAAKRTASLRDLLMMPCRAFPNWELRP